jgi:hypothetical protein
MGELRALHLTYGIGGSSLVHFYGGENEKNDFDPNDVMLDTSGMGY